MDHKLIIRDFIIRYTYSSFITTKEIDLYKLSYLLIKYKITRCLFLDNNYFIWTENDIAKYGTVIYSDDEKLHFVIDKSGKRVDLPNDIYAFFVKFINKIITENQIIYNDGNIDYIDFFVDPIIFSDDTIDVSFYPYMRIFQDGITVTKYEVEYKNQQIELKKFIDDYVNFASYQFKKITTSPSICHLMIESYHKTKENNFYNRVKIVHNLKKSKEILDTRTYIEEINGISYHFVTSPEAGVQTLANFNLSLNNIIVNLISKKKNELFYLLFDRIKIYRNGNLWVGRPYIYINDFNGMKRTGTENNNFFGLSFQHIMNRSVVEDWITIKEDMKNNLRLRDDSLYYTNSAVSLFVNSSALQESKNTQNLIDNLEVLEDYIEYGYMINKALLQLTKESLTPEEINKLRWKANYLIDFEQFTYYHETRYWIKHLLKARSLDLIKEQTKEAFEIRLQERLYTSDKKNKDLSISLSVIFGLLASVSIAEFIGEPLLEKLDFFSSLDVLWIKSASFFITLFIIWTYIGFIRYRHK